MIRNVVQLHSTLCLIKMIKAVRNGRLFCCAKLDLLGLNSKLDGNNQWKISGSLTTEIYRDILYIYGTVTMDLVAGWNVILNPIPLSFTVAGISDVHFPVINNTASDEKTQFLQAKVEKETNMLCVWSWSAINNATMYFNTEISTSVQ